MGYLVGRINTIIMIAKIALMGMLAAVAVAAPEPQIPLGYGLGGHVASHVPVACTPSTEEIEIQSCAPRAETVCKTEDVVSEEITYEKRCAEVVNKHCAGVVGHAGLIVKREAEAEADPQFLAGLPYAHGVHGFAHVAPAPVAYAVPQAVTKTIETMSPPPSRRLPLLGLVTSSPRLTVPPLFTP